MPRKAVLFDLDGTLLDTLDDLADSMNAVLERLGLPTHPVEAYKLLVGNGTESLVRRAIAHSTDTLTGTHPPLHAGAVRRWPTGLPSLRAA